ncbi:MAG: ComEA family DNA-binding protein [Eubacteriales bacterium]
MKKYSTWILTATVIYALGLLGYYILEEQKVAEFSANAQGELFYVETEKEEVAPPLEEIFVVTFPINLNTASLEELDALPSIGEKRAEDIIAYRDSVGGFQSIEEIMEISGIGVSTYEGLKDLVYLE